MPQAVEHDHPNALVFLRKDCENAILFFRRQGVRPLPTLQQLFGFVTDPVIGRGEEEAAAALKEILALPEREIAVVSDPRLLHHWTNAGQQPLAAQPHSLRLDPRLRPATPPAPGYAAEEALQALSDQPPLVGYPSPHMERMLRPPFEDGEFRIVVAGPPPS